MSTNTQNLAYTEIDPNGNLLVNVHEYNHGARNAQGARPILKTETFKVSRQVLMDSSKVFEKMLGGAFQEGSLNSIDLHEDTCMSMEIWFRVLHDALNDKCYTISHKEIWETIPASRKYDMHLEKLEAWFAAYWSRVIKKDLKLDDLKELLYPSQAFDHATAFAYVTKSLAHCGYGHIQEDNPTQHWDLHVEGRVIQQINAARGSIRKQIIKGLFNPLDEFCPDNCAANEKSLKAYIDGVRKTNIWPIEDLNTKSNRDIICGPGFQDFECVVPEGACSSCTHRLGGCHVFRTGTEVMAYWEGLCLDCMDISERSGHQLNSEYWRHNEIKRWSMGCRFQHGRNTWYFSYMGRPEYMSQFQKEQKARKNRGL